MIESGVFYVPRDGDGNFVRMRVEIGFGVVIESATMPDIHTMREAHLVKALAYEYGTNYGLSWSQFHEHPMLNGDTYVFKGPGGYYDTDRMGFFPEVRASSLFNEWDLAEHARGISPGWQRLIPALQKVVSEQVDGCHISKVSRSVTDHFEPCLHTTLEVNVFSPGTEDPVERDQFEAGGQVDVVVGARIHHEVRQGKLKEIRRYSPYLPEETENIQDVVARSYPGAKWVIDLPSCAPQIAPK